MTLDHIGIRATGKAAAFAGLPAVRALARRDEGVRHARALGRGDPFRDLHPYIKQLVDAFGPRRTFWGTDLTRMPCTCRECVSLFTEELPWPKGEDLEWVMGRGVCARLAAARQVKLLPGRGAGTGAPRTRRDPG